MPPLSVRGVDMGDRRHEPPVGSRISDPVEMVGAGDRLTDVVRIDDLGDQIATCPTRVST